LLYKKVKIVKIYQKMQYFLPIQ